MLDFTPSTRAAAALYISKLVYDMGGWVCVSRDGIKGKIWR